MAKGNGGTRASSPGTPGGMGAKAPMAEAEGMIRKAELRWLELVQSGEVDRISDDDYRRARDGIYDAKKTPLRLDEKYTADEADALTYYSKTLGADRINGGLNGTRALGERERDAIAKIDRAMARTKLSRDMVVFRGTDREQSDGWKGYVSTSRSVIDADKFRGDSGHLHAYLIPKGTPVAYIYGGGEDEFLLPRGFMLNRYRIK